VRRSGSCRHRFIVPRLIDAQDAGTVCALLRLEHARRRAVSLGGGSPAAFAGPTGTLARATKGCLRSIFRRLGQCPDALLRSLLWTGEVPAQSHRVANGELERLDVVASIEGGDVVLYAQRGEVCEAALAGGEPDRLGINLDARCVVHGSGEGTSHHAAAGIVAGPPRDVPLADANLDGGAADGDWS